MENNADDDAITIDLTHPYEADWMARGRKENQYTDAFRDHLQQEYGLSNEEAAEIGMQYFSDPFRIPERDWDIIWQDDRDPGQAVEAYLGQARVQRIVEEYGDEPIDPDLEQQAERQEAKLKASRKIERYLQQQDHDPIDISGFGPWHETSPLTLDEDEWDALIRAEDPVTYLGEDRIQETFQQYSSGESR